ncbi:hypothetical protein [Jannaschia sp. R86511]|uniref:hypothetical protein n=1 Tax=Jannaschia sp. R86511 TaxID=3093853 RepID=UPI0036D39ED8
MSPSAERSLSLLALERFADDCSNRGHTLCGSSGGCLEALESLRGLSDVEQQADFYDLSATTAPFQGLPQHHWPASALIRLVKSSLLEVPWTDSLRRSTHTTLALARLGELGFPPDALVRTYLGAALQRQVLLTATAFRHEIMRNGLDIRAIPSQLQPWLPVLEADLSAETSADLSFPDAAAIVTTGAASKTATDWVRTVAVAHLIDWRIDAPLVTTLRPQGTVVPAGRDATVWVFDRFSCTSLDEWQRTSLDWELLWLHSPAMVADSVGLSSELLASRPSSERMVMTAIRRRLLEGAGDDPLVAGLSSVELRSNVVALLQRGQLEQARTLASRAHEMAPGDDTLTNVLAFCTIPHDPAAAKELLNRTRFRGGEELLVQKANLATVDFLIGAKHQARLAVLTTLRTCGECKAWLWDYTDPGALPSLTYRPIRDWARRLLALL